jgi:uncharacterized protein YggT (Ycf19 family)
MTDLPPPDDRPPSRYGTTTTTTRYGEDRSTRGYAGPRRRAAAWYRLIALIWLVVAVIDVVIAARFLGLLLGASTESAFVSFVYGVAAPLVAPFEGIFGTPAAGAHVFEVACLVAIIVYTLLAAGLVALLRILSGRRQPDVPYDAF